MSKLRILTGFLLVFLAVFPLMAESDEESDHDPIQVGYVTITPVTNAGAPVQEKTGLFSFETFGEKRGLDITTAGVLPSSLTTSTVMFVNASGRLSRNVGIAIANPVGGAPSTNITMALKDEEGTVIAHTSFPLDAGHQTAAFVNQMFEQEKNVPRDLIGTLVVTSSQNPVGMMGLRFRGENFSTLPLTPLGQTSAIPIHDSTGGPGALLLPEFAVGGGWESEIVLVNSGTTPLLVRVDLFKSDGTPLVATLNGESNSSFTGISIPPGGVYVLARRDSHGDSEF